MYERSVAMGLIPQMVDVQSTVYWHFSANESCAER